MKRLLVLLAPTLLAAPLLLAAGCSSSSGTPTASPATAPATSPAGEPSDGAGAAPATSAAGDPSDGAGGAPATSTGAGGGAAPTKPASTSRCRTGDLKLSVGEGDGAAGTTYAPLIFKNVSDHTCTLSGFPGVSWVTGNDGHQVNVPFARADAAQSTATLAAGAVGHATLATHDVSFYDAAQCKPVSVRGLRVYPPDESKSIFVPLAAKACSVNGINKGTVSPIAKGAAL
jgi:hypothetical protein